MCDVRAREGSRDPGKERERDRDRDRGRDRERGERDRDRGRERGDRDRDRKRSRSRERHGRDHRGHRCAWPAPTQSLACCAWSCEERRHDIALPGTLVVVMFVCFATRSSRVGASTCMIAEQTGRTEHGLGAKFATPARSESERGGDRRDDNHRHDRHGSRY